MRSCFIVFGLSLVALGCPVEEDPGDGANAATSSSGSGASSESGMVESCTPGEIDACLCPGDIPSTQICLADGSGFSACDCVPSSDSSDGGDGTTTSSGDTTSAGMTDTGDGSSSSGGPPPECNGEHPLVEGDLRYCERAFCYCGDFSFDPPFDDCYAMEIAEACCPVDVVCY